MNRPAFIKSSRAHVFLTIASVLACTSLPAQTSNTNVAIGTQIIQPNVKRFGINLGTPGFYGSYQILKNMLYRNPGFEGLIYQSTIRCASGTTTSCSDDDFWSGWPAGFWTGAGYEMIWGASKGATGTIVSQTAANSSTVGANFQFSTAGPAVGVGDYMIVRKSIPGNGDTGWWMNTGGGGSYTTEMTDLSPWTLGKQALQLTAGSGQSVSASGFFDSQGGAQNFLLMNGTYSLTFSAKAVSGTGGLTIQVGRNGGQTYVYQTQALTSSWATYTVNFSAAETISTPVNTGQASITLYGPGTVLLDDVSLVKTNGDPTNTTAYADPVVNALRQLKPGVIRYWADQLGDTIQNLTAPISARQRSGFTAFGTTGNDVEMGIHEFIQLCQVVGAEPYIVIPITTSTTEASWLIDYLSGPITTAGGAMRASRGQTQPWTSVIPKIHLEFGNEAWNSTFKGGDMEYSQPYGNRSQDVFAAMRSNPNYVAANMDLVIGGQAYYPELNYAIQQACDNNDSFTTAPYQQMQVDDYTTLAELWAPAYAESEMDVTTGNSSQTVPLVTSAAPGRTINQNIYEVNYSTLAGAIDQTTLDAFAPALGAGISVIDHMLLLLQNFGMREQNIFALPQWDFTRPDGKTVRLWGSVVDMGVTDRRRPQFLAEQLVNQVVGGNMVSTTQTGANPTWNQPLSNGVQLATAHYLHSYSFSNGSTNSVVLVNLNITNSLPVTFSGSAPTGTVTMSQLTSGSPSDTNETSLVVVPTTTTLTNFNPASAFSLPPNSITVLSWAAGQETVGVSVSPSTVSLSAGATQQFTAQVTGTTTTGVTWSISPSTGSISTSGLYTAPASIASATTLTVTATSTANTSASASAVITLNPTVAVSLTPATVSLASGATQQFTAQVTGTSTTGVTWSISPSTGSISASGLYTAPASIAATTTVTVTATSTANPAKSASSVITLNPTVAVSLTPATVSLASGATQQFTAQVTGTTTTGVTWSISPSTGTISTSGLYTAPASIASATTVTVTATSTANSSKSASATITLTPATAVKVTVTPGTAIHSEGVAQQFSAQVTGTTNTAVTWSVSPAIGSISASGLYSSPATVTSATIVTITATSVANPGSFGTATMTVLPPLMISPETVKLNAGQQMQFASTRGGAAMAATWSISPASGAGTITSSGLYTAPSTVTTQVTVTLTATTTVQLQQTNNATITLVPTAAPSAPTATPGTPNPNFYEVITWTTAALSTSQVEYGPTTAYGRWTTLTTTPGSQQTATTASLSAGLYHYRTHSYTSSGQDVVSQDYTFVTNNNITGPVISNIKVTVTNPTTVGNNNSATLTFSTNNAATAMVGYGPTTSYAYWPSQTTSTTTHSFQLQWLTSGTWNFVIYATDQFGNQTISSNITFQVP